MIYGPKGHTDCIHSPPLIQSLLKLECLRSNLNFYFLRFLKFIYFERGEGERACVNGEGAEREGERESQAGSILITEPDTGLDLTTVRT